MTDTKTENEKQVGGVEGPTDVSRRGFLQGAGALAAATTVGAGSALVTPEAASAEVLGPLNRRSRQFSAYRVRQRAARVLVEPNIVEQPCSGDEDLYADRRASFFKTLPQNSLGEVDANAYQAFLDALESGNPADMDAVPLSPEADRRLANPLASYAYEMTGGDAHSSRIPAAPAFTSDFQAVEMAEVYWQALTRDIPFGEYGTDATVAAAVADLNAFSSSIGPTEGGNITAGTLFRGETPGDLIGPYLSQFLWLGFNYGPTPIEQRYFRPVNGDDFMLDVNEWLSIQRGAAPATPITFEGSPRFLHDGRGLGEWVHGDVSFQAYLNAALIMLGFGGSALSDRNPYKTSTNQGGFVTFGAAQIVDLVTKVAGVALKTAWYHKWLVHRRLRPEVFGARVEFQRNGTKDYGLGMELLNSDSVTRLVNANGNALLPMAFPEGSPTHPAYPAGHAAIAGACCTVLKAFFNESFVIPAPVEAANDGSVLNNWGGADLTLGNEINKLAANISLGRDIAGVHYRTDGIDGISSGEQVAIDMLRDYSIAYAENADGFELTRFDGQRILISGGEVTNL